MNPQALTALESAALNISRGALLAVWQGRDKSLDPMDALLVATIIQANVDVATSGLDEQMAFGPLDRPPPDMARRRVSISRVADSLDLRFETVRRRVNRLKAKGVIVADSAGVIVPESYFRTPANAATVTAIDALAALTYRRLADLDYFAGRPLPSPPCHPSEHPYRAVARYFMNYALRVGGEMRLLCGDYMNLLLVLNLSYLNTVDLGDARAPSTDTDGAPLIPDSEKTPISIAALARESGVPFETTRRRLAKLAENDICRVVGGGYIVPADTIIRFAVTLAPVNEMNLTRLYRNCALVGAVEGWQAKPPLSKAS
ncbi:Lrp/AsnC family transcriptional regulator [Phenylobacterium sp.]|uniref:Lrp/AsnC family transcriptional regulator n=1 Tax=Phenylobacterium sp. TaxID=1871053 RepID=UPI00272EF8AD|nr:Lrp/AsnC family transcriptional regulator [Phenylobacterium sp.]MDP2212984.1 Lrp/AsnC family transcriptional regulator [Phenylobacterium sp.]